MEKQKQLENFDETNKGACLELFLSRVLSRGFSPHDHVIVVVDCCVVFFFLSQSSSLCLNVNFVVFFSSFFSSYIYESEHCDWRKVKNFPKRQPEPRVLKNGWSKKLHCDYFRLHVLLLYLLFSFFLLCCRFVCLSSFWMLQMKSQELRPQKRFKTFLHVFWLKSFFYCVALICERRRDAMKNTSFYYQSMRFQFLFWVFSMRHEKY